MRDLRDRHQRLELNLPPARRRDWQQPSNRSFAACIDGPCDNGRKFCPSPDACLRAEREERHSVAQKLVVPLLVLALVAIVAALWVLR